MDIYKMKWKAKFRVRKVKSIVKLAHYNLLKKFNLEKGEEFYYHLQRELLRDLIRTPAEHEYLEEHGLLPEPEPEPEPEEPEKEKEPGLVRELGFFDLMPGIIERGNASYLPTKVKEYEDRLQLVISKVENGEEVADQVYDLPHQVGERYTDFTMDGHVWRWDNETAKIYPREL